MEIVELRVQVEDSQLKKLQADVQALKGTTINLGAGGGGGGKGSDPTAATRAGLKATEQQATKTGQSILSVMGKVAKWTAVTTAVYAPIKAFKEAITTIKALDTEMVNIQKVTGATANQMKQYQEQAYSLASQYGRSAMDVAESMTAFARAGYGEQLSQMAELSTLMQNVGYVSADTANSMLLAVDAAWHLNGSQTELMKVMDGVDKITNQNATDFGKMAEGMTVAASVFAESGESIQTFASMVGTGTAVTQRSGSEIARGLRTVLMNIRQIKGETEDGELIDGESIAKASLALKEFAGINTMENGELRKASDILGDLAAKWEELDSVQQSAIAEALAGKRQANILTALMGNWDMYEKQMEEYATAAGTALKENEIYMDSWAAKSEQLKSTWTEFVSGFVNTGVIKGALDGLIGTLNFLDSGVGESVVQIGLLTAGISGLGKAGSALKTAFIGGAFGKELPLIFAGLADGAVTAGQAIKALGASLLANPLFMAAGAAAVTVGFIKAVDAVTVTLEEQEATVAELKSQYEQLYGAGSELAGLQSRIEAGEQLNALEERRLAILQSQADAMQQQIENESRFAFNLFQQQDTSGKASRRDREGNMVYSGETKDAERLKSMNSALEENARQYKAGQKSLEEYRSSLLDLISDNQEWYDQMQQWEDLGFGDSFTDAQREAKALYESIAQLLSLGDEDFKIVSALDDFQRAGVGFTEYSGEMVVNAEKLRKNLSDLGFSAEEAQAAIDGLRADGVIVIDVENDGIDTTLSQLEDLGIAVKDADGWEINIDSLDSLADELGLSSEQANALAAALDGVDGVSLVDAQGDAVSLLDTMSELGMKSPMELLVSADTSDADAGMAGAQQKADTLENSDPNVNVTATDNASATIETPTAKARMFGDMRPSPTLTAKDNASSVINGAVAALGKFVSKTITLTARYVTSGSGPGGGGAGSGSAGVHKAAGDINFRGGPVLLGDEYSPTGAPRPELVITRDGKAFLAGVTGPVATTLPAGSRIFKYSDTLDVFSGQDMTEIAAYSGGDGLGGMTLGQRYIRGANGGGGNNQANNGGGANNANNANNADKANGGGNKGGGGNGGGNGGGKGGGGGKTAKEEEDEYLEQLKKELELLKAQYSYLEASGASTEELNGKSGEIQNKLHEINERLRETGGEEKDIVDNSTEWWQELDKIRKVTQQIFEDERDLLETESELMEKQGKGATERIAKLRQIQDNLHREAEYLRSIKADQAEINRLSIKWWEIQNDILAVQQALMDELDAAISKELRDAQKARDSELSYLDAKIKKLQEERDVQEEQVDLEERRKRVEEARFALENAQNQRSVRYFNAATGQWEWAADSKNVKSAEEALKQAQKDLQQTEKDKSYDLAIKAIEAQKDEVNARYNALESRWEALSDSFADPLRDIRDILRDLLATGKLTDDQVKLIKSLVGDIEDYTQSILDALTFKQYMTENPTGSVDDYLALRTGNQNAGSGFSDSLKEFFAENPDIPWSYTDSNGITYNSDGTTEYATSTTGTEKSTVSTGAKAKVTGSSSSSSSSTKSSSSGTSIKDTVVTKLSSSTGVSTSTVKNALKQYGIYDSGGVLSGYGGIKATGEDEIVIPPEIAGFMLKPSANHQFRQRMSELGYLYGTGSLASANVAGISQNKASSDHYGDIYQYGNITLSEGQARGMTVYELAQLSKGLRIYS